MSMIATQPYPATNGWQDLLPFLVNGWSQLGLVPGGFKGDGNDLKVSAALRIGDTEEIATGLPQLTTGVGARILSAFAQSPSGTTPIGVRWESDGRLTINPAHWDWAKAYGALIIGGEAPR